MSSQLVNLLVSSLSNAQGKTLWLLDEQPMAHIPSHPNGKAMTNRYDVAQRLHQAGWDTEFSDFEFESNPEEKYDTIVYRVSKERALSHYLINQASQRLAQNGTLVLIGHKHEGIKSYIGHAKKLFGGSTLQNKVEGDLWLAHFPQTAQLGPQLNDQDYPRLRQQAVKGIPELFSKPGLYGWNKVDQGSQLLVNTVRLHFGNTLEGKSVLDLGCGYGYLSLCLAKDGAHFTATDNNAAAVAACQANFKAQGITATACASDAAKHLDQRFDLVVCNPPFHTGFETSTDLTTLFLTSAKHHITKEGCAFFVTNLHIPIMQKAKEHFGHIEEIIVTPHFRVSCLKRT